MLGDSKIEMLYHQIMSIFDFELTDERSSSLRMIYEMHCNESKLPLAVCSPKFSHVHLGYCYTGGNLEYIVTLKEIANDLYDTYTKNGIAITDTEGNRINKQAMTFYILLSSIGNFGRNNNPYYIENDSTYQIKMGKHYIINPKIPYFTISDNLIYLVNQYNIKLSETEYIMLKSINYDYSADGKSYIDKFDFDYQLNATFPQFMLSAVRLAILKGRHAYYNYVHKRTEILNKPSSSKSSPKTDDFLTELNNMSVESPSNLKFKDFELPELDNKMLAKASSKSEKKIKTTLNNKVTKLSESPSEIFDKIFGDI